mgnify:CR=1 FL=1
MTIQPFQVPVAPAWDAQFAPGIGPEDFTPPVYTLTHGGSQSVKEGALVGQFYCPQLGKSKPQVRALLCRIGRTRTLFGELNQPPICVSDDRITPRPGGQYPGPCAQCEKVPKLLPWQMPHEERRRWCWPTYTLLMHDLDENLPFILRLKATGASAFSSFLTGLRRYPEPYTVAVVLTVVEDPLPVPHYEPRFSIGFTLPPESSAKVKEYVKSLWGVPLTAVGEEVGEELEAQGNDMEQPL